MNRTTLWYKVVLSVLSVLGSDEVELAEVVDADVLVCHHVAVLRCGGCEDGLRQVSDSGSGWCHRAVDSGAVKVCCCSDPVPGHKVEVGSWLDVVVTL